MFRDFYVSGDISEPLIIDIHKNVQKIVSKTNYFFTIQGS